MQLDLRLTVIEMDKRGKEIKDFDSDKSLEDDLTSDILYYLEEYQTEVDGRKFCILVSWEQPVK